MTTVDIPMAHSDVSPEVLTGASEWPRHTPEERAEMGEEELMGNLAVKVWLLCQPGGSHVRPSRTEDGHLRYRIMTQFEDTEGVAVRSAIGMIFPGQRGEIRFELHDFAADKLTGGDILTTVRVEPKIGRVTFNLYDDSGTELVEEDDTAHDMLLDAHIAADAIRDARRADALKECDLTGLFKSGALTSAGTVIS